MKQESGEKEERNILLHFRVTPEEDAKIKERMAQLGTDSVSAFLRKMALDGYVIHLDLPELREMITLLRRYGNNLNQIARRINSTGRAYAEDIEEIKQQVQDIWNGVNQILKKLAALH